MLTNVSLRVVRRIRFFIDRFEYCDIVSLDVLQEVTPGYTGLSELRLDLLVECLVYFQ